MATNKTDKVLNVPTLRFPGFTDEWEILTLGKICDTFEYGMNGINLRKVSHLSRLLK